MGIKVIMYIYNYTYMLSFRLLVYITYIQKGLSLTSWSKYICFGRYIPFQAIKSVDINQNKKGYILYIFQDVIDGPNYTYSCNFIHTQTLLCTLYALRKLVIFSSICKRKTGHVTETWHRKLHFVSRIYSNTQND